MLAAVIDAQCGGREHDVDLSFIAKAGLLARDAQRIARRGGAECVADEVSASCPGGWNRYRGRRKHHSSPISIRRIVSPQFREIVKPKCALRWCTAIG